MTTRAMVDGSTQVGEDAPSIARLLAERSPSQLADLLARVPRLSAPQPPKSLLEVADRLGRRDVVIESLESLDLTELCVLSVVACADQGSAGAPSRAAVAAALPSDLDLDAVGRPIAALEQRGLLHVHGERMAVPSGVRSVLGPPAQLGLPFESLAEWETVDQLRRTLRLLGEELTAAGRADLLPGSSGARKADLIADLTAILRSSDAVGALLAAAPDEVPGLFGHLATRDPVVAFETYYWYGHQRYGSVGNRRVPPEYWLYERGLALPAGPGELMMPLEVGLAARGGRPYASIPLAPPPVADETGPTAALPLEQALVDREAATAARATVHRIAGIIGAWAEKPVDGIKSGGLGARALKGVASGSDLTVEEAGLLVDLAWVAGLSAGAEENRGGRGRNAKWVWFAQPSPGFPDWATAPLGVRWSHLASTWLVALRMPGVAGRKIDDANPLPAMSDDPHHSAKVVRDAVLEVLAQLPEGASSSAATIATRIVFDHPSVVPVGEEQLTGAVELVLVEAEALGVVNSGRLSTFGARLVQAKKSAAVTAFDAALPESVSTFVVQADHTITVLGTLELDVQTELELMADLESSGGASTYRLSEPSIRRALDAGRTEDDLARFLDTHSAKAVPKAVQFLVADVARRHGHLRVTAATTVIVSDDVAVLADAVSHRRTRKLRLRMLAPTVAVSPLAEPAVLAGLRDAGFFPVVDGVGVVRAGATAPQVSGPQAAEPALPSSTPEPSGTAATKKAPNPKMPPGRFRSADVFDPYRFDLAPGPSKPIGRVEAKRLASTLLKSEKAKR